MSATYDVDSETLTVDSNELKLPSHVYDFHVFGDVVVIALSGGDGVNESPDIPHPGMPQNLVGVDNTGYCWTVERDPEQAHSEHYIRIYELRARCVTLRNDDGWVEINRNDGAIVESFSRNEMQIGGNLKTFPTDIASFETVGDMVIVVESGGDKRYVSAFDNQGTRRWHREFHAPSIMEMDGKLVSKFEAGMGTQVYLEHDLNTGEPVAVHSTFDASKEELKSMLPAEIHHLIAESN